MTRTVSMRYAPGRTSHRDVLHAHIFFSNSGVADDDSCDSSNVTFLEFEVNHLIGVI